MLSIIDSILNLVLTALATLIAVLQFKNERRKAKEEEYEKQRLDAEQSMLKGLVASTEQVLKSSKKFIRLNEDLLTPQSEDRFVNITNGAGECLKAYGVTLDSISALYERLLINEKKFPLSLGFERYINAFRDFLMTQERHKNACDSYKSLIKWCDKLREESSTLQEKDVDEFNNRIFDILDDIHELGKAIYHLYPYIKEIRLKYEHAEPAE